MRVLIADDNEVNRKRLRAALIAKGHETEEAADGVEALEKLRSGKFDTVVSDVLMPRMDGYRLCYEVRRSGNLRDTLIIIYSSTSTSPADEQAALKVGADRFLRKPAAPAEILQSIEEAFRAPKARPEPVAPGVELEVLREYSEGLVGKLEEANAELEAAQKRLAAAYDSLRESERAYRELVELAPTGIVQTAPAGKVLAANAAFAGMLGYGSAEEFLGLDVGRDLYFDPAERAAVVEHWAGPGPAAAIEFRLKKKDGTPIWVQGDGRAVPDSSGNILRYEVFVTDIDKRKTLEESTLKLLHAVEQVDNVVFMTDTEGTITYVNPAFERVYGYSREETLGKTPRILKSGPRSRAFYQRFWQRLLAGESVREEFVNKRRDGQLVPMESSVSPVLDSSGRRIGFISLQYDLTESKRSEERLRVSEEKYRLLFDSNPLPMWVFDSETLAFLAVNQAACRHYGYSLDEFLSMTIRDIRPPEDVPSLLLHIESEGPGFQGSGVWRHRKKDGTIVHAEVTSSPFVFDGRPVQLVLAIDVTDRQQAQEGMRRSEERFRRLFESGTIGIVIADLAGRTLEANDAYLDMIGYTREELLSGEMRWDALTPPEYRDRDRAAVAELERIGSATPREKEYFRKDGTRIPILIGIAMLKASEGTCIAYVVDLSERRKLEQQFRQAQKMEAVGQLAGGVAHDFNNLLTAILGYSDMLAAKLDPGSLEFEELDEIRKAGERAASLTRQLLAFSRQQVLERGVLDINDLIADIEKMLRRLIGEDVELTAVLDPALRRVFADAGQLEQVIMNLAVNARDAMPRGGKLTLETANVELDEAYARQHVTVRPGRYVMIAVSDTGIGMSGETLGHVFEPFFTTKGLGKGTGLGLATVYGIVKQSGGYIWAYSEVGKGTTFKIYLPLVEEVAEVEPAMAPDPAILAGSETVLLVEDEESVRVLSRTILENFGYTVLEAASGKDGLEIARQYSLPIHLLLSDVVMPEMGGPDLASGLEAVRHGVRVLYMSGYTDDAVFRHGLLEKGRMFLQKPFTPETLARKVREALGG